MHTRTHARAVYTRPVCLTRCYLPSPSKYSQNPRGSNTCMRVEQLGFGEPAWAPHTFLLLRVLLYHLFGAIPTVLLADVQFLGLQYRTLFSVVVAVANLPPPSLHVPFRIQHQQTLRLAPAASSKREGRAHSFHAAVASCGPGRELCSASRVQAVFPLLLFLSLGIWFLCVFL